MYIKLLKTSLILAFICLTTTAMAQTAPESSWSFTERYPEMPPLNANFGVDRFTLYHPNKLQMPSATTQKQDTVVYQSLMLRHTENHVTPHINIKSEPNIQTGDALKHYRERIVHERRRNSPSPLPPPTPRMR